MRWYRGISRLSVGLLLAIAGGPLDASAANEVDYQPRANRWEGVTANPVSGFDIELLSARFALLENTEALGKTFGLRFFLNGDSAVNVVARERDLNKYYRLDKVTPASNWRSNTWNQFEWPTAEVVRKLGTLRLHHLAVVARLSGDSAKSLDTVAPVLMYQESPPVQFAANYVFTFGLRDESELVAKFVAEPAMKNVATQELNTVPGRSRFDVRWNASAAPAGWYRVEVSGYKTKNNDKVAKIVRFYHKGATP